jgi:3-oxoacyl-[acyl-carrier protein] reductase
MAQSDYLQRTFGLGGRRAVVTGASRGIGRAAAVALAAAGAEVLVHYYRSQAAAQEVVAQITGSGGRAWSAAADLADPAAVGTLFAEVEQRWGALDILVNNAGDMVQRAPLESIEMALLKQILDVNLTSCLLTTRAAIPVLRRGAQPVIINMTSMAAHNGGFGGVSIYTASKGGILSLTRSLARELAPGVRVNAISPGAILTDMHRRLTQEETLSRMAQSTPLGRLGEPEDCAAAVIFLCSPASAFITGEVIEVNGGLWMS